MKWPWHDTGPSAAVARAMQRVPRENYLPEEMRDASAADRALPIGHGQTISQPTLVAYMTEQLDLSRTDRVLEIGTGSGFQTAILAELAGAVFSIERIPELALIARERLARAGYSNIQFRCSDGSNGWPEAAPFDAIIVTAAAEKIPEALIDQLRAPGRMIVPVGPQSIGQDLILLRKDADGTLTQKQLWEVRFVPLVVGP